MAQPKNTEKMPIHLNSFQGGMAVDFKYGIANSYYFSAGLDFRTKASQMSTLPGMRALSGNLDDLILCMTQDPTGNRYAVGDSGFVYRINTSGVISTVGNLDSAGAAGIAYFQPSDQVYMASQHSVSMYGQTQNTPQMRTAQFGKSASTSVGVVNLFNSADNAYDGSPRNNAQQIATGITSTSQVSDLTTNTYQVTSTTILEDATDLCYFAPDIEPFYSIAVYLKSVGSGDLTLTLHDSLNNKLAAVTITNANLKVGWNEFVFSSQVRAIPSGAAPSGNSGTYHFHLTSSVSNDTTTVGAITQSDLSSADFLLFAYRLVQTNNTWHPMAIFAGVLCVGNGPYVSTYDFSNDSQPNNSQWSRHALLLDPGFEVCGMSVNNQYLVVAAEKRSTSGTHSYQQGKLYFWDGTNQTPNFSIDIPMGAPYSIFTLNNITYFYCAGSLFAWGGGQQVIKVRYIAYQNTDYLGTPDNTVINPNMMTARYNLLMAGFPSTTTNTNTLFGIYSWGAVELTYPNSFGFSYYLSNGQTNYSASNNLKIGMVQNFVDTMYTSWYYMDSNSVPHYGLDILDNFSTPAPNFSWQSLIYDGGVRYKKKKATRYKINFLPLPANTTLTLQTNRDRAGFVNGPSASTGDTQLVIDLNQNFHEYQWGFVGTSNNASSPVTITGITMEIDPLEIEVDVTKDG